MRRAEEARKYTDKRRSEMHISEVYLEDIWRDIDDACCRGQNYTFYDFDMTKTNLKTVKEVINTLRKTYGYQVITPLFLFLWTYPRIIIKW